MNPSTMEKCKVTQNMEKVPGIRIMAKAMKETSLTISFAVKENIFGQVVSDTKVSGKTVRKKATEP